MKLATEGAGGLLCILMQIEPAKLATLTKVKGYPTCFAAHPDGSVELWPAPTAESGIKVWRLKPQKTVHDK
jgi:hypothetical protein